MFALTHEITIAGRRLTGVNEVEIKRGISSLVGTAKIKVPSTAVVKKTDGSRLNVLTAQAIKRGDFVTIDLGYNGKLFREFTGFVSRVNLTQPVEIECEDAAFQLREKTIAKIYGGKKKSVTLGAVLSDIVAGTGITVDTGGLEVKIEKLILATDSGGTVSRLEALQHVIDRYGLVGYFDTGQNLFVGLRQGKRKGTVKLKIGWNTIKDDELKYHNKDEQKVKITAIYVDKLGKRTEVKLGDKDGEARTIFLTDVSDPKQIEKLALNELEKYKFNGFAGKITAFLQPFAEPGSIIQLSDPQYSSRNGNYYCDGVEISFGESGARRKIEIGAKV